MVPKAYSGFHCVIQFTSKLVKCCLNVSSYAINSIAPIVLYPFVCIVCVFGQIIFAVRQFFVQYGVSVFLYEEVMHVCHETDPPEEYETNKGEDGYALFGVYVI